MNEPSKVADGVDGGYVKRTIPIMTLFVDIDGVLFTNESDHHARKRRRRDCWRCSYDNFLVPMFMRDAYVKRS